MAVLLSFRHQAFIRNYNNCWLLTKNCCLFVCRTTIKDARASERESFLPGHARTHATHAIHVRISCLPESPVVRIYVQSCVRDPERGGEGGV